MITQKRITVYRYTVRVAYAGLVDSRNHSINFDSILDAYKQARSYCQQRPFGIQTNVYIFDHEHLAYMDWMVLGNDQGIVHEWN